MSSAPRVRHLKSVSLGSDIPFIIHGQGTFVFKTTDNITPAIFYCANKEKNAGLKVIFSVGAIHVTNLVTFEPLIDPQNKTGLLNKNSVFYWFSIDTHNQTLYAGVGEPREETVIYDYKFPYNATAFLESLVSLQIGSISLLPMRFLRDPITSSVPLVVKNVDELTMDDVASGKFLPKANLSPMAQKLYDCINGKKFLLDDADFPDFSKAIKQSIENPNGWCYKRLAEKAKEFSKDPHPQETYLRITLGQNNGESPGVPYVMEIWPVGHYSPIHSHSDANAVIRVLHGNIQVELYPFLCDQKESVLPFATTNFTKDEVTWISPTLNQIHRLTNLLTNTEPCITIQCYMYNEDDDAHYDYFDYLGDNGIKEQYTPDFDMDFIAFKQLMKAEWFSYVGTP